MSAPITQEFDLKQRLDFHKLFSGPLLVERKFLISFIDGNELKITLLTGKQSLIHRPPNSGGAVFKVREGIAEMSPSPGMEGLIGHSMRHNRLCYPTPTGELNYSLPIINIEPIS